MVGLCCAGLSLHGGYGSSEPGRGRASASSCEHGGRSRKAASRVRSTRDGGDDLPDRIPDVVSVRILRDRVIEVGFDDGVVRVVDLAPDLWGEVFDGIRNDDEAFAKVFVDKELGTVAWPDDIQLDPLVLHGDYEPLRRPAN